MDAHDRSSDSRSHIYPLCGVGNAAKHTPDKGAVPLAGDPGMKVIGDQKKFKASTLSHLGMRNQVIRFVFLTG
jgi:hypothetical protein